MNNRIARLVETLNGSLDGLIVTDPLNVHYLFGVGVHESLDLVGVISRSGSALVTDSRYWEHAERLGIRPVVQVTSEVTRPQAVANAVKQLNLGQVGFEADHLPVATWKEWAKFARKAQYRMRPTTGVVKGLRAVKDADEMALLRRAAQVADEAFAAFCAQVRVGMTEREGAWLLESFMRTHGAEAQAFDPIVASGPNAALPHATPTERAFQTGEPITLDFGARVEGYHSDITRTICLGPMPEEFKKVYQTVLQAQKRAEKKIRAGVRGKRADAYARRVIEKAGHGEHFGHGTGHGVGLEIHEAPRASKSSKDTLEAGMTITIEPGIYVPGWGGVRIEDLAIIQKDGLEILSHASKDPVIPVR